jgi:hypothetical protein
LACPGNALTGQRRISVRRDPAIMTTRTRNFPMQNENLSEGLAADRDAPATLTSEQAAQVTGGVVLSTGGLSGRSGLCCLTCGSYGRPVFAAVAAETAA